MASLFYFIHLLWLILFCIVLTYFVLACFCFIHFFLISLFWQFLFYPYSNQFVLFWLILIWSVFFLFFFVLFYQFVLDDFVFGFFCSTKRYSWKESLSINFVNKSVLYFLLNSYKSYGLLFWCYMCPGYNMLFMEQKILCCILLKSYRFELGEQMVQSVFLLVDSCVAPTGPLCSSKQERQVSQPYFIEHMGDLL